MVLQRAIEKWTYGRKGGVVHKQANFQPCSGFLDAFGGAGGGEVQRQAKDLNLIFFSQGSREGIQQIAAAGNKDQAQAAGSKMAGIGGAKAFGGACDDGPFAILPKEVGILQKCLARP
jgi:hypothetical protein